MGILVADSGSTKTDWIWSDGTETIEMQSPGLNPHYVEEGYVEKVIQKDVKPFIQGKAVNALFFYGAGCASEDPVGKLKNVFSRLFQESVIEVNHDLFGAARALFRDSEGVAAILGTGSSSCFFKNGQIADRLPSLGFMIGDEGSAGYFGKIYLRHHFYRLWPNDLAEIFHQKMQQSLSEVLGNIYDRPFPNTYVAGFAEILFEQKSHPFVKKIIVQGFSDFIDQQLLQYTNPSKKVGFVGSLAFYQQDILHDLLSERGCTLYKVIQKPVKHLLDYHLTQTA